MKCALTGNRILGEDFDREKLREEIEVLILTGCDYFYCGMAEGYDLVALEILDKLKNDYDIQVEACIPFRGQENGFDPHYKNLYRKLLPYCDYEVVFYEKFVPWSYFERNRYMVDHSDVVLAYNRQKTGGTVYTMEYARKKKRIVKEI